nr:outer membrane beta-barrel protein [Mesorhizobium sp.]
MRTALLTSAMLVGFCSSAFAADALSVEPSSYNWTGAYIGAVAGVNFLKGDVRIPNDDPSGYDGDSTSASIGGQVGYQYQFDNNFVVGAEARLVAVFNKKTVPTIESETFETAADWQGDIVAKAGYAMGNFLPYVKGGVAFLHLHIAFSVLEIPSSTGLIPAGRSVLAQITRSMTNGLSALITPTRISRIIISKTTACWLAQHSSSLAPIRFR